MQIVNNRLLTEDRWPERNPHLSCKLDDQEGHHRLPTAQFQMGKQLVKKLKMIQEERKSSGTGG